MGKGRDTAGTEGKAAEVRRVLAELGRDGSEAGKRKVVLLCAACASQGHGWCSPSCREIDEDYRSRRSGE